MERSSAPRRLLVVLVVAGLVVAACGDDDDTGVTADVTTTTTSTTAAPADDPADATTSTEPEPEAVPGTEGADQVIEVTVTAGRVEGGDRHRVTLGDDVALVVRSDAADEIHLHGYDLYADVVAGEPAVLRFDASIPGVFEAELHDARLPLVDLEIS